MATAPIDQRPRDRRHAEVQYVLDFYSGAYLPDPDLSATTATGRPVSAVTQRYVPQLHANENADRYRAMVASLDPDGLLAFAIGSLAGQVAAIEEKAARTWTRGEGDDATTGPLGHPEEAGTLASELQGNADGEGAGWSSVFQRFTTDLLLAYEVWVVVDGHHKAEATVTIGDASETIPVERPERVRLFSPLDVASYTETAGRLTAVRFCETERVVEELGADTDERAMRLDYTLGGWTRSEDKDGAEPTEKGTYVYVDERGNRRLPVFRVRLPLRSYHTYAWARKCAAILAMRARRDAAINLANSPYLVHKREGTGAQSQGESSLVKSIKAGSRFVEIGSGESLEWVEPTMSATAPAKEEIEAKTADFLRSAYQSMEMEAKQATATEVRQRQRSGPDAILSLLTDCVERAENEALFLLAQAHAPQAGAEAWRAARVERSRDFVASDERGHADAMMETAFGTSPAPLTDTARRAVAVRWCEAYGVDAGDEDEVEAAVDAWGAERGVSAVGVLDALGDQALGEASAV